MGDLMHDVMHDVMHHVMRYATLVVAVMLGACRGGAPTAPTVPVNSAFTMQPGQAVDVAGSDLRLTFVRVTRDSRCPTNVNCIWAGNAAVEIEARRPGATETIVLNTLDGATEGVAGSNRIRLLSVMPVPVTTQPITASDYRVTLMVVPVGTVCTLEARPGLQVSPADSLAPEARSFTNVSVVARDGAFVDSVFRATWPDGLFGGAVPLAFERRGTYVVTVRAAGYAPWTRAGVVVAGDVCHVVTVNMTARLARP